MPLKLNVGLSQKVGLPDYGSLGASCHVEVELDGHLLQNDAEGFQRHVRQAFVACRQAVHDELARHTDDNGNAQKGLFNRSAPAENGQGSSLPENGSAVSRGRRATASQIRAIYAIASQNHLNLTHELQKRFGTERPDALTVVEASFLIDQIKSAAHGAGGRV